MPANTDKTLILGGGIAGLSLAYFLKRPSVILEKEKQVGGLSRSFDFNGIAYDIGPHIMFSKNKEILALHTSLVDTNQIRRSNQIFYKGRLVKYPFENDLAALPAEDRDYCLNEFLNNPYETYAPKNMDQFFLKTFGEGITRLYLRPYNEKIWKFDPSCLDLQMVERIPKPPKEDIIKSANGVPTEGYLHQLYFHYPKKGGFQSLVDAYTHEASKRAQILPSIEIQRLSRKGRLWTVETNQGAFSTKTLVNCMPLHQLFRFLDAPEPVKRSLAALRYNSIHIVIVQAKKDKIGDHFALYFPDKDILFHRLSKLNFLGENYSLPDGGSTLQLEVTFRPGSHLGTLGAETIKKRVVADLEKLGFVAPDDVTGIELRTFEYAYVIYDLDHRKNADRVLKYLRGIGIRCSGRFAEFEYMNTDAVAEHSQKLAAEIDCR